MDAQKYRLVIKEQKLWIRGVSGNENFIEFATQRGEWPATVGSGRSGGRFRAGEIRDFRNEDFPLLVKGDGRQATACSNVIRVIRGKNFRGFN